MGQSVPTVVLNKNKGGIQDISLTISGQELFYSKMQQTFSSMVSKAQREQLKNIHDMLLQTDMVLRPELDSQKKAIEVKMSPFKRMNTVLGTRKQQSDFEHMMEEELVTLVES